MKQKKLALYELKGITIPTVSVSEILRYHEAKDGTLGMNPLGCQIITCAGRHATNLSLNCLKVSSPRFGSSSSFEYCNTIILINSTLYQIPKELRVAASRECKHRNIHYAVVSKKLLDQYFDTIKHKLTCAA